MAALKSEPPGIFLGMLIVAYPSGTCMAVSRAMCMAAMTAAGRVSRWFTASLKRGTSSAMSFIDTTAVEAFL